MAFKFNPITGKLDLVSEETPHPFPFQCLDAGEVRTSRKYHVVDTGAQILTASFNVSYNFAAPGSDTDAFELETSNGEITINEDDTYIINYSLVMFDLSGSNQIVLSQLQLDTGSGFTNVVGATGTLTMINGSDQVSRQIMLQLSKGDKLRVNVSQFVGTNTASTLSGAGGLTIESLRDESTVGPICIDADEFEIGELEPELELNAGEL